MPVCTCTVLSFFTTFKKKYTCILHHLNLVSTFHMLKLNTLFGNKLCTLTVVITTSHFLNNCLFLNWHLCRKKQSHSKHQIIHMCGKPIKCRASETSKVCNLNSNSTFTAISAVLTSLKGNAELKTRREEEDIILLKISSSPLSALNLCPFLLLSVQTYPLGTQGALS